MAAAFESNSPRNVERRLYEANRALDDVIAQTPETVREMEVMFGSTPRVLPDALQSASKVLEKIKRDEEGENAPRAFGKVITLLRTEKRLTPEQLATKTGLDVDEILEVESGSNNDVEPMIVSVLADYFKLQPRKLQKLAGLTQESNNSGWSGALGIAACAKPEFDKLSREEKKLFHQWVKQLRR